MDTLSLPLKIRKIRHFLEGQGSDCQERTGAGRPQVCWRVSACVRVISVVMREHQVPDAVLDIELAGRGDDIDQDWR